jgi:hypothetical protein
MGACSRPLIHSKVSETILCDLQRVHPLTIRCTASERSAQCRLSAHGITRGYRRWKIGFVWFFYKPSLPILTMVKRFVNWGLLEATGFLTRQIFSAKGQPIRTITFAPFKSLFTSKA